MEQLPGSQLQGLTLAVAITFVFCKTEAQEEKREGNKNPSPPTNHEITKTQVVLFVEG